MNQPVARWRSDPSGDPAIKALLDAEVAESALLDVSGLRARLVAALAVNALPSVWIASAGMSKGLLIGSVVAVLVAGGVGFIGGRTTAADPSVTLDAVAQLAPPPYQSPPTLGGSPVPDDVAARPEVTRLPATVRSPASKSAPRVRAAAPRAEVENELRLFERGEAALTEGRYRVAAREFERYLERFPKGTLAPEALLGLFRSHRELGDTKGMVRWATHALDDRRLAREHQRLLEATADALLNENRCEDARALMNTAAQKGAAVLPLVERVDTRCR